MRKHSQVPAASNSPGTRNRTTPMSGDCPPGVANHTGRNCDSLHTATASVPASAAKVSCRETRPWDRL